jgi:hypothetical protein
MSKEQENSRFSIKHFKEVFKDISRKTKWDLKKPLLWGYFFTHHETNLLENAKTILVQKGYTFVDIHQAEKDGTTIPNLWWLHIEKAEVHTPETLSDRNNQLEKIAGELGIDAYDGWDVGPVKN